MSESVTSATRCPACGTTFRVTRTQLSARQGQVRCGRCNNVFDGYAHIVARPDPDSGITVTLPPPDPMQPAPIMEYSASLKAVASTTAPAPLTRESGLPPAARAEPVAAEPAPSLPPPLPPLVVTSPAPPVRRSGAWAAGCLLLLLALGAQTGYFFRNELAAMYPPTRPLLDQVCGMLDCTVGLPQQPRAIAIEASDMQVNDPSRPALVTLTATLRNHGATVLGFPALDVVLTNTKDHTLARRIFLPEEYLEPGVSARSGLAANAEMTVRLTLDTQDLGASGFRLDLLPAPPR